MHKGKEISWKEITREMHKGKEPQEDKASPFDLEVGKPLSLYFFVLLEIHAFLEQFCPTRGVKKSQVHKSNSRQSTSLNCNLPNRP